MHFGLLGAFIRYGIHPVRFLEMLGESKLFTGSLPLLVLVKNPHLRRRNFESIFDAFLRDFPQFFVITKMHS